MKRLTLLIMLCTLCLPSTLLAQQGMFKALFLFNFAKNIGYPENLQTGSFVIAVLGNDEITPELERLSKTQKIGNQKIVIKSITSPADALNAHIIYVPSDKGSKLSEVITTFKGHPTLIVSQKEGACQKGACINFTVLNGKMKYEISKSRIDEHQLQVSSKLLSLGLSID